MFWLSLKIQFGPDFFDWVSSVCTIMTQGLWAQEWGTKTGMGLGWSSAPPSFWFTVPSCSFSCLGLCFLIERKTVFLSYNVLVFWPNRLQKQLLQAELTQMLTVSWKLWRECWNHSTVVMVTVWMIISWCGCCRKQVFFVKSTGTLVRLNKFLLLPIFLTAEKSLYCDKSAS